MALDQERSSYFLDLLRNAEASGDIAALNNIRQQYLTESGTPEAYAPIASVGQQAFQQSKPSGWDIPLEAIKAPMRGMGETIAAIPGIDLGLGEAMQSWAQPDAPTFAGELTQSWGPELMPQDVGGVVSNLPGAVGEQAGQIGGSIASMKAGARAGARIGRFGGARGRAIGGVIGGILGPMFFSASQVAGPTANKLALANGRAEPDSADWAQAILTAGAVGALDRAGLGAIMSTATKGALMSVAARTAGGMGGELVTEAAQTGVEQFGSTYGTPGGVEFVPGEIASSGVIGGGAGGGASAAIAIPQEMIGAMPADQEYMRRQALAEQATLAGIDPSQQNVYQTLGGAQVGSVLEGRTDTRYGPSESTMGYYDPMTGSSNVIVENAYRELDETLNKTPSRKQVQAEVRRIVSEESIDHKVFLEGLQDKTGFLDQFYNKRKKDIDAWLETPVGARYAHYMTRDPNGHRSVAAEFISDKARKEGVDASYTKSMIASIRNFLRKKEMLGFDADFSDSHIYDLITKAAVQATRGTPGAMPTVTREGILESKGPQDPSRRRFMKQVGGAAAGIAADPRMILEPATPAAVEAPMYTGMTEQYPGSVYEFSIATDPNAGWTSSDDPADGDMDVSFTHDPNTNEVIVYEEHAVVDTFEVDDMHADAEVLDYVRDKYGPKNINDVRVQREEMDRDPETGEGAADYWGDADERFDNMAMDLIQGEKTMAGVERVERDTAYDYFEEPETPRLPEPEVPVIEKPTQKALPAPEEVKEKTDAELYVETIDEIMNIYDEDATAAEASRDGTLNDRIISYAAETPFTREELWEGVNQRMEALEEPQILEARARKPKEDTIVRDISNRMSKKIRPEIRALDIPESEKSARLALASRLRGVMGEAARKRGINAGDFDVFIEQSQNILDGNLDVVEEFIAPFVARMTGTKEKVRKAETRRDQRAKRIGKTDAEILKYRPKGGKHPMEGQMTYPFAQEEIDRQEKAGDITVEEAEIRRLAVNNIRRIFKGKAGPTVKRTITEAVYGIGAYEDLVPWSELYTEEQAGKMGERAEVAQAEARRTRYDPTDITNKQKQALLKAPPTAEELSWIESGAMPSLTGKRARLLFLRAPAEFKSPTEQREFETWRKDQKRFVQEDFKKKEAEDIEKVIEELKSEGRYTKLSPGPITRYKESQSKVINVDPIAMERMDPQDVTGVDTDVQIADVEYTAEGEAIDPTWYEIVDDEGVAPEIPPQILEAISVEMDWAARTQVKNIEREEYQVHDPVRGMGYEFERLHKTYIMWPSGKAEKLEKFYERRLREKARDAKATAKSLTLDDWEQQRFAIANLSKAFKERWKDRTPNQRRLDDEAKKTIENEILKELKDITGVKFSADHIVAKRNYGIDFAFNLFPLPKAINEVLRDNAWSSEVAQRNAPLRKFFDYLDKASKKENADEISVNEHILFALAASGLWADGELYLDHEIKDFARTMTPFPEPAIRPSNLKEIDPNNLLKSLSDTRSTLKLKGLRRIMATYDFAKTFVYGEKDAEYIPFIPAAEADAELANWGDKLFQSKDPNNPWILEARASKEDAKAGKVRDKDYTEHFNDGFWYKLTQFLWGKPVQSIRDFNKVRKFGTRQGTITAADEIADLVQRAHSVGRRAEGLESGTDMMQDVSMRSGEFYSTVSKIFAMVTGREGVIDLSTNQEIIDHLVGKRVKFSSKEVETAAKDLKTLLERVYKYGKDETSGLKEALDLRGEGDTVLPRVWNIEYLATRQGKVKFLRTLTDVFSPPGKTTPIFEEAGITVEDLYDAVINSGGFVQGDWTNIKADQLRSEADIKKDLKIQKYLDSLPTESMIDGDLVLDDLQAIIPRFVQKAVERTEYAKRFGKNDEILRELLKKGAAQIREHNRKVLKLRKTDDAMPWLDEKRFEKEVWAMARILRNQYGYDMANMPTRKWLQRISNAQIIAKLPLVTLASIPEFFTPMLKGDVSPHHWFVDLMAGSAWAGYKAANGVSKLLFNTHLPAMRKYAKDIGGLGIVSDIQLLRELGIADIQAMGDMVSTRYANPNFARGGLRAGAKGTIVGKIPKRIRAIFNMQVFMQATLLTTMTEMQQLMAMRNFQRHVGRRIKFVYKNKGKTLTGRQARLFKQFTQDLGDYGITEDIDLDTPHGQAQMNAGALRFIDQVITRPNDATTAKAFKNPLVAPLVLFKRFITTFGNTLMTSIGNDFATKVDNVERAKQVGKVASTAMVMYGSVMFAEMIRGAIRGDLDDEDFEIIPKDFSQFMRRLDRTGLLSAPGAAMVNLTFPYKRGWWDSTQSRVFGEVLGPVGGDVSAFGDTLLKGDGWQRFLGQVIPLSKPALGITGGGKSSSNMRRKRKRRRRRRKRN